MKLTYKEIISTAVLLAVIGVLGLLWQKPWQTFGSIDNDTGGYDATTTSTWLPVQNGAVLKAGPGTFGSIVSTGLINGYAITVYDATTSDVTKRANATSSLRILGFFQSGATTTALTYDTVAKFGILASPVGTQTGTTTLTWK